MISEIRLKDKQTIKSTGDSRSTVVVRLVDERKKKARSMLTYEKKRDATKGEGNGATEDGGRQHGRRRTSGEQMDEREGVPLTTTAETK
uniref:Uncharacterized protein n=1 Tax=Cucumis melo TaxID=3656 RepID=A0A9I9CIF8_CUCME